LNAVAKFLHEVRKLLCERITLILIAMTAAGAVWFSLNGTGKTASDIFIISAAKNSAFFGAFLFSLLSLLQFHRDFRNNTDVIIVTCTDPLHHQVRRTLALICVAVATTLLISLFALPYGIAKTGDYFQFETFFTAWYLIFLSALVFAVLLSAGFYMMTMRLEISLIIMSGLVLLSKLLESMFSLNPSYLFYWVQTTANNFSDLVTNRFQIDMLLWNRLFCLFVSLSVWILGLSSLRRYGCGLPGSFIANCRRAWIPVLLITTIPLSCVCYAFEPIFDDSRPMDFSSMVSSGTGVATFTSIGNETGNPNLVLTEKVFSLDVNAKAGKLSGVVKYKLSNEDGNTQALPVQTNTGIKIDRVLINNAEGKAVRGETGESSTANWSIELPASEEYEIEIYYSGRMLNDNTIVQRATYGIADGFVWLPAIGAFPNLDINISGDCTFYGTLSLDEKLEPIFSRGTFSKGETLNGRTKWLYTGITGSQSTSIFAAEYMTKTFEAGGLNIELKHFAKHGKSIREMDAINVIKAAIDYFTEAFGPLIYRNSLTILELPAYVSGGFAGGNMSAMDESSFNLKGFIPAESFSLHSGGGIDVLVHEIAHQWWGIATMPIQDGVSCWSAEGITCYSTYCFMKYYFGEEYAQEHFTDAWMKDLDTYRNAFYIQHPEYLEKLSDKDKSNIIGSFRSIRLYSIMPLMMLNGETALGGTENFVKKLSELYLSHLGQLITYNDFLSATGLAAEVIELE